MTLHLQQEQIETIQRRGRRAYPMECCGFLLGIFDGNVRRVHATWEAENIQKGEAAGRRYTISPESLFHCDQKARREGMEILGVYHSHPDHPAEPSEFDAQHAVADWSYLIVQISAKRTGSVTAWRPRNDRAGFDPEDIRVDDGGVEE
ncbi:MAG: M67 family metallopeptidase [Candidatus Eisenbacteria bacterium]|uniref:M67 family metallopeptidase n=1 Tax=Eiseniibacteriota bacterium TaxID=2212470 RepID=A0A948RUD0_UNCEI|nr:M67 family metallopeptidase [Candidatus Eisenbacteria bacterium]MBU1950767.1 M67 family metallopeptidase [Candidatus Eisenbacteria bacterium]MBU2690151.1 M67 family metallopeptidase [Candidatus Eisenbacteria bacterium]